MRLVSQVLKQARWLKSMTVGLVASSQGLCVFVVVPWQEEGGRESTWPAYHWYVQMVQGKRHRRRSFQDVSSTNRHLKPSEARACSVASSVRRCFDGMSHGFSVEK